MLIVHISNDTTQIHELEKRPYYDHPIYSWSSFADFFCMPLQYDRLINEAEIIIMSNFSSDYYKLLPQYASLLSYNSHALKLIFLEARFDLLEWSFHFIDLVEFLKQYNIRPICWATRMMPFWGSLGINGLYMPHNFYVHDLKQNITYPIKKEKIILSQYAIHHNDNRAPLLNLSIAAEIARAVGAKIIVTRDDDFTTQEWLKNRQLFADLNIETIRYLSTFDWYELLAKSKLSIDLGRQGGGRVSLDCAITKTLAFVHHDSYLGSEIWSKTKFSLCDVNEMIMQGIFYYRNNDVYRETVEQAYQKVDLYDISEGRNILEVALGEIKK